MAKRKPGGGRKRRIEPEVTTVRAEVDGQLFSPQSEAQAGVRPSPTNWRPRQDSQPSDVLDLLDRHGSSATESDDSLDRYLRLFRDLRRSATLVLVFALAGVLMFGVGVAGAAWLGGVDPRVAAVMGVCASGAMTVVGGASAWRVLSGRGTRPKLAVTRANQTIPEQSEAPANDASSSN